MIYGNWKQNSLGMGEVGRFRYEGAALGPMTCITETLFFASIHIQDLVDVTDGVGRCCLSCFSALEVTPPE
jgi:hypothetical protein